jgi:hypothetical protein
LVAPFTLGQIQRPSALGSIFGSSMGRPLASMPLAQVTLSISGVAQELARHPVEGIEEAVAIGVEHRLARLARNLGIEQAPASFVRPSRACRAGVNWKYHFILPGIEIKGQQRAGVEIVARTLRCRCSPARGCQVVQ